MKSKYLLLAMLFGVTLSTVACKKCQTCTYQNDEIEVCREGIYNTPQLYTAYINSLEDSGYDCK